MANRQYIGARYVPIFFNNNGSAEWISGIPYEPLTIVTYLGNSYTSTINVPSNIGDPPSNPNYWVNTANYNAQLNTLQGTLNSLSLTVDDMNKIDIVGCVLRYDSTANNWIMLNNTGHTPKGISSVSIVNDNLRVTYDKTYSKVITGFADSDETFLSVGVNFGASLGLSYSDISVNQTAIASGLLTVNSDMTVTSNLNSSIFVNNIVRNSSGTVDINMKNNMSTFNGIGLTMANSFPGYSPYAVTVNNAIRIGTYANGANVTGQYAVYCNFANWNIGNLPIGNITRLESNILAASNIWFMCILLK